MAEFDCTDRPRSGSVTSLHSCFENNHLVNNIRSQMPTLRTKEQISSGLSPLEKDSTQHNGGLDESSDSLNQLEENSPIDISSALKSVGLMRTWDLKKNLFPVPKLFSTPEVQEDSSALSPVDDQDDDGDTDPDEEEKPRVSFQSKYIHIFPLYQDYCLQSVKDDLHRLKESFVSELISPEYLQRLHSRLDPRSHSEITYCQLRPLDASPPSPSSAISVCSSSPTRKNGFQRRPACRLSPRSHSETPSCGLRPVDPSSSSSSPSSTSSPPIRVTPCTLWQDLDEVKASGLLSSLTTREICLQESMFELIGSEASYLRSLNVVVNHFYASEALKQTLSSMEHRILFSNIRHVMTASQRFLMDLETRLGESVLMSQVGDIVLQHHQDFHRLYVPYVTNMMYQEALVNQQLKENRNFMCSLKKLEGDPVCQRKTLKSFLVLPFQRITRIKLLLESIRRLTEPDSDSISNLEKAIDAIDEIVTDCDQRVKKMKQIEELVCLEMLLDFSKVKAVPLVVSSRFLVHQGPMKRLTMESTYNSRMSFISVYVHLFNDLLIISSKKDEQFIVEDHAGFPEYVTVELLNTEVLGVPTESFLLHLARSQTGHPTAMILVAHTRSDKETWMKELSSKQRSVFN